MQVLVEKQVKIFEFDEQGLVAVLKQLSLLLVVDVWRLHRVLRVILLCHWLQLLVDPSQNTAVKLINNIVGIENLALYRHLNHSWVDVPHWVVGVLLEALKALKCALPGLQQFLPRT